MEWWGYIIIVGVVFVCVLMILIWIIIASNNIVVMKKKVDRNYPIMNSKIKEFAEKSGEIADLVAKKNKEKSKSGEDIKKLAERCVIAEGTLNKISKRDLLSKKVFNFIKTSKKIDELKNSRKFLQLEKEIKTLEEDIEKIRERYNTAAKAYNKKVTTFPSKMIAERFKFNQAVLW